MYKTNLLLVLQKGLYKSMFCMFVRPKKVYVQTNYDLATATIPSSIAAYIYIPWAKHHPLLIPYRYALPTPHTLSINLIPEEPYPLSPTP
jgi:hypothetical protein